MFWTFRKLHRTTSLFSPKTVPESCFISYFGLFKTWISIKAWLNPWPSCDIQFSPCRFWPLQIHDKNPILHYFISSSIFLLIEKSVPFSKRKGVLGWGVDWWWWFHVLTVSIIHKLRISAWTHGNFFYLVKLYSAFSCIIAGGSIIIYPCFNLTLLLCCWQIFLSTRWAILLNLHVEMFRVNKYPVSMKICSNSNGNRVHKQSEDSLYNTIFSILFFVSSSSSSLFIWLFFDRYYFADCHMILNNDVTTDAHTQVSHVDLYIIVIDTKFLMSFTQRIV